MIELTDDDGQTFILNPEHIIAVVSRYPVYRGSRIRVRDGTIYDSKEQVDDVWMKVKATRG